MWQNIYSNSKNKYFCHIIHQIIMENVNHIVGTNLKILREASGYTQDSIAKKAGINRSAYANYETGDRELPYEVLEKLTDIFGCEPHILFEENISFHQDILACAFRIENLSDKDIDEVSHFKGIVRNYLKMIRIENGATE